MLANFSRGYGQMAQVICPALLCPAAAKWYKYYMSFILKGVHSHSLFCTELIGGLRPCISHTAPQLCCTLFFQAYFFSPLSEFMSIFFLHNLQFPHFKSVYSAIGLIQPFLYLLSAHAVFAAANQSFPPYLLHTQGDQKSFFPISCG